MDLEKRLTALESRLAFVSGEAHALKVIMGSFIAISPLHREMLASFPAIEDVVESRVLPADVPEDFLEGARQSLGDVRRALESRAEDSSTPPPA
jgi:hypothetical protein